MATRPVELSTRLELLERQVDELIKQVADLQSKLKKEKPA